MLKLNTAKIELKKKAEEYRKSNFYKEAVKEYLKALMLEKNDYEIYYGLGVCFKYLGKADKAIKFLEQSVSINELYANSFYELGICYFIDGQICTAMHNLIKCIHLDKKNIDAQMQLAMAHEAIDEKDMALLIYQKIMDTNPEYMKAYEQAAFLLIDMQEYKEAGKLFNRLIKNFPQCIHAYLGLGSCFEKLGRKKNAKRYYKKFVELSKDKEQKEFILKKISKIRNNKRTYAHLSIING